MELKPIIPINLNVDQTNYYWFKEGFSLDEIKSIEDISTDFPFEEATTVSSDSNIEFGLNEEVRKSQIKWLLLNSKTDWIYNKIVDMAIEANTTWEFNLHSIIDSIQYTEYYEGGGHYDWHVDIGPQNISHRKVSVTIQLSDSDEYEGGDLELWSGSGYHIMPRGKGVSTFFPSFTMHRITPVTKGTRKSLVLWIGGVHYK